MSIVVMVLVALALQASGLGGSSDGDPCARDYRTEYIYYGEPHALSLEEYCDNWYGDDPYEPPPGSGDETYE